jgi:hypothetical protein
MLDRVCGGAEPGTKDFLLGTTDGAVDMSYDRIV